jgi:phage host-nuclease inhibitor protein Gam
MPSEANWAIPARKARSTATLKEIEEEEGGSTGAQVAVSEAIQDLAARLAERLHEEADQRLAALTDKHKAEIAALNDSITALRNEVGILPQPV